MKTKPTLKLLLFICTMLLPALFLPIQAQISAGGVPYSFQQTVQETIIPVEIMPSVNLVQLQQEDQQDDANGLPPRFGFPHNVNLHLNNSGLWQEVDGGRLWRLDIQAPGALSLNLLYEKFWLPEGASLFIYNKSKSQVIGAFTEQNNKGTQANPKKFATGLVYGNTITLEYFEPHTVSGEGVIEISKVVHGYRYISVLGSVSQQESFGDSGSCQVNVNCEEGNSWQDQKTSVAMILVNGTRWCTGSLINNAREDGTPYFLTADHCLDGSADAINSPDLGHWSFYWNYESPTCSDGSDFLPPSTNGATIVANNSASDFALLRLTESPLDLNDPLNLYFNGWDRSDRPGSGGVGIHHPSGDIKKIATHNIVPNPSTNIGLSNPQNYWQIQWSQTTNGFSVTEGGSSGSPLFNSNGHVIGQLYGGSSINCSDPANDPGVYGKIYASWDLDPNESRRRLSSWLDPDNTGVMSLNGTYPSGGTPPPPPPVCNIDEPNISLTRCSPFSGNRNRRWRFALQESADVAGSGTYSWSTTNFTISRDRGTSITGVPNSAGSFTLFCTATYSCPDGSDITHDVTFTYNTANCGNGALLTTIYPNPFNASTTIEYQLFNKSLISVFVRDMNNNLVSTPVSKEVKEKGTHSVRLESANLINKGTYLVEFYVNNKLIESKRILYRSN
ncbi:trypsin-like peptidase domain-containing protein [Xanthovirga aplysinae]|uniref:trypsin-like peptidase domain-containing protein n=1 Tax=Xanthovirga aplysinae TaxID=2529853 RepID=UPI0012BD332F|nr:trypsin-like peptidase domain-containing protein [Xanthovirga aplysinae]MTI29657.1 trypsin-like serine protease [Xanthovirga aplysinae]